MRTLVVLTVLLAPLSVAAAEQTDVIVPDRAGAARSAGIARPGEIQLELGLQYARERAAGRPTQHRAGGESTLTVGLTDRLEVAVGGPEPRRPPCAHQEHSGESPRRLTTRLPMGTRIMLVFTLRRGHLSE